MKKLLQKIRSAQLWGFQEEADVSTSGLQSHNLQDMMGHNQ